MHWLHPDRNGHRTIYGNLHGAGSSVESYIDSHRGCAPRVFSPKPTPPAGKSAMIKPFDQYTLEVCASVEHGVAAQILCYRDVRFVGRIDFHAGQPTPPSYFWHPNGTADADQIYIILAMPIERFDPVEEILRIEGPMVLELWPASELTGTTTDGYGGVLRSLGEEPLTEEQRRFFLTPRPVKAPSARGQTRSNSTRAARAKPTRSARKG
jgi:hypothetical protein